MFGKVGPRVAGSRTGHGVIWAIRSYIRPQCGRLIAGHGMGLLLLHPPVLHAHSVGGWLAETSVEVL